LIETFNLINNNHLLVDMKIGTIAIADEEIENIEDAEKLYI